jgi:hypothetical protein
MSKKLKRKLFKGISLESKWKERTELQVYPGSKSGNNFITSNINYNGQNRFSGHE